MTMISDNSVTKRESTLKPKQLRALHLLAAGMSARRVAEKLGVTPKTVSVWQKDTSFALTLAAEQTDQLRELRRRLVSASDAAVTAVIELAQGCENPNVRLRAATAVIDRVLQPAPSGLSSMSWVLDADEVARLGAEMAALELTGDEPW